MTNGLNMNITEFRALPIKSQLTCLYENQCEMHNLIKGYKLYYKVVTIIGSFLVAGMLILFKLQLGV